MMITALGLFTLQKAINQYIALDPDSKHSLKKLSGKVIAIEIQLFANALIFYIKFNASGVILLSEYAGNADVTLSGTPFALVKLGLSNESEMQSAFQNSINLTGDAKVGAEVKAFFDAIEIDWEEHLSHLIGDVLAHQVGTVMRSAFTWGQESKTAMQQNVTEYLQEEARQLPPREEIDDFFADLDRLVLDVERAYLRAQQLVE